MNKNINLAEILKDCPKGWKLYTPIFGEVEFEEICGSDKEEFSIVVKDINYGLFYTFTKEGFYFANVEECVLFPSKDQRDWSKFTAPWYKKEKDTIEQSQANERAWLYLVSDVLTWKDGIGQYLDDPRVQELAKKLCSKYAQKLYNPSVLSNSSNTIKNEQKSPDKVEPKFKVGDWVVRGDTIAQILDIQEQYYVGLDINGKDFVSSRFLNCDKIHLWTIQNAKDGDVLVNGSNIFIFHFINNRRLMGYCHVNMDDGHFYNDIGRNECFCTIDAPVTPSTKEQRDLLFQKIKETGYKWNTETNTFEKLVVFGCKTPNRFDPKTLKEFDKVLVKEDGDCIWRVDIISVPDNYNDIIHYLIGNNDFDLIIPYNEDTKHLVGTAEEAPEFYRYWDD